MDIEKKFPSVADMEKAAVRRMPGFIHEFMIGGIGEEECITRNRSVLENVLFLPRYLSQAAEPIIRCSFLGQHFDAPFGVAPLGLAGLMWPKLEFILASASRHKNIPFILSTYATTTLEEIIPIAGENAWFQFYPPNDPEIESAILNRCKNAGYKTLVLTVDTPVPTRKVRNIRSGLSVPPRFDIKTLWQMITHPSWSLRMLFAGVPHFENLAPYFPDGRSIKSSVEFISKIMFGHITNERFEKVRSAWDGNLLVKGVLSVQDAKAYLALGADGLIISNHGGRQLDAAPSAATVLPEIRNAVGNEALLIADGGVRSGLDIARMIALGANFVLLGRAFVYAVAALDRKGAVHLIDILKAELTSNMGQIGCPTLDRLPEFLYREK